MKSNKEVKEIKKVKEEFRSLFVDSGTDLVIPERQTSDSRRVWKMKPIWSWIESTISQTRQEVIEEIDKLQKQCSEADGMVDGMTALHTLREKLLEDLNKK